MLPAENVLICMLYDIADITPHSYHSFIAQH